MKKNSFLVYMYLYFWNIESVYLGLKDLLCQCSKGFGDSMHYLVNTQGDTCYFTPAIFWVAGVTASVPFKASNSSKSIFETLDTEKNNPLSILKGCS